MKKYQKFIDKNKIKLFGFIPARMAASRFPGKPLKKILGIPMIEHVFKRASLFDRWEKLYLTTCDKEIQKFSKSQNIPYIMTSKKHKRCLDRIYEAANKKKNIIGKKDIIICVQGDEPMMRPEMIENVISPFFEKKNVLGTVLAMDIISKDQFYDKNIVKIIHDENDEVLYTSRSPIPYAEKFDKEIGAKRIYGIFAFKWEFLKKFYKLPMSNLETLESCDSNRLCDNGRGQFIARQKYFPSFSVDCPADLKKVERYIKKDFFFKKYLN